MDDIGFNELQMEAFYCILFVSLLLIFASNHLYLIFCEFVDFGSVIYIKLLILGWFTDTGSVNGQNPPLVLLIYSK